MIFNSKWKTRLQIQKDQERIHREYSFRKLMQQIQFNESKTREAVSRFTHQALEAEKAGDHSHAVQMAEQAKKLERYLPYYDKVKHSMELASANGVAADTLKIIQELPDTWSEPLNPEDMIRAQEGMILAEEKCQMSLEQSDILIDSLSDFRETALNSEAESFLQNLIDQQACKGRRKQLLDTAQQLEKLRRNQVKESK